MSNSVGHNLIKHHFPRLTVIEHQSKLKNPPATNSFCATASLSQSPAQTRKYQISTKFYGHTLSKRKQKLGMGTQRPLTFILQAGLTADPASEPLGKFSIDGNIELLIDASAPTSGSMTEVTFRIKYTSDSLLLHWGGICDRKEKWILPSHQPEGTKKHKNRALRTPFLQSGSESYLKLEIDDPRIQAIEFLIYDEDRNKWMKNNGQNFHIRLPQKETLHLNISVPEDLVQIQAYLMWGQKGKQMYSPEQEKEEYEAACAELLGEVVRGASVDDIRNKLTKRSEQEYKETANYEPMNKISDDAVEIPDDLVQIQAYIRWEQAGKPIYSPEKQLREFEVARKELQSELEKGVSLDEIRKNIVKGEIKTKVSEQLKRKRYFSPERINRKQRDLVQLINKHVVKSEEENISFEPTPLTAVQHFAKEKELDGIPVINKDIYRLGERELLALVTKAAGKTKIHLATDFEAPLTLHWAVSTKGGEWLPPPPDVLPPGSVSLDKAAESKFSTSTSANLPKQVQCFEMEIEDGKFRGMPFLLLSNGKWIKNNGSDFYVEFTQKSKQVHKVFPR